jgi:hypothetical protein
MHMWMRTGHGWIEQLTCIVARVDSNSLDCSINVRSSLATLARSETRTLVPASCRVTDNFKQTNISPNVSLQHRVAEAGIILFHYLKMRASKKLHFFPEKNMVTSLLFH